jgi:ribonuclease P protein component
MFFYQTKDRLSYDEINTKTIQLFEKFIAQNIKEQTEIIHSQLNSFSINKLNS